MVSTYLDLDTNMLCDSGYSSNSPASYCSMSPSHSSQDAAPYQDLQSLQLSQVINCNLESSVDIKYEYVNVKTDTNFLDQNNEKVTISIVEQPVSKFRYRYISEMHGTHGSLMGQNSSKSQKTYPTVELKGFHGDALIRCSLYQIDKKAPHSHRLVVRRQERDIPDPHELTLNPRDGYRAVFQGMGIIHTAKRDIANELYSKKKIYAEFEKGAELSLKETAKLKSDSDIESKQMNLNQVVLRYEAYEIIKNNNQLRQLCEPVYSTPISNMKCALTGELKITRLSTCVSSAAGGDDLFLFVEKVGKKNIKVKFFEMDNDEVTWSDTGTFTEADVHHQYAIALRTPPYKNKDIDKYVTVYIQLERPSDGDRSEPIEFKYKPRDGVSSRKRARTCSSGIGSSDLPSVLNDNGSGTTISEEYNKNEVLNNLLNYNLPSRELEFLAHVKTNSSELLSMVDPNIFDPFDPIGENLVLDCGHGIDLRTSFNNRKFDTSFTKNMTFKISNILKIAAAKGMELSKIQEQVRIFLLECNEKHEDLLHRIVRNKEINEGIYLIKMLDKLNLFDIVNLTNDDGDNCLHVACTFDSHRFIKSLMNLGANSNTQNNKGKTPLHIAVEEEFENCIVKILDKESYTEHSEPLKIDLANDNGYTALHIAVKKRNLNIVKMLIEKGNASTKISCSKNGNNVLHLAVEENCTEIVKFLINNTTVRINDKNTFGYTPLSLAQSMGADGKGIVDIILQKTESIANKMSESVKNEKSDSSSGESDDDRSIRSLKIVEDLEAKCEDYRIDNVVSYFNENLIEELSKILVKNEKWIKLCELLNLHSYVCLWKTPKVMFNFINESKEITVDDVIESLSVMNEVEAVNFIKNA